MIYYTPSNNQVELFVKQKLDSSIFCSNLKPNEAKKSHIKITSFWDSTLKICTFRFAISHYQMIGWLTGSGAPLTELWLRPYYSSGSIIQLTPLIPNQGHSGVRSFHSITRVGGKDTSWTGDQQDTHQCHSNTGDKANMDVLGMWEEIHLGDFQQSLIRFHLLLLSVWYIIGCISSLSYHTFFFF